MTGSLKVAEAFAPLKPVAPVEEEPEGQTADEPEPEQSTIERLIQKAQDSDDKKKTMVEDLEEIDNDNDQDNFEAMLKESEAETGERHSFTEKKADDDDDDGDVNIDEDEGSEKGKGVANSTLYPKVSITISAKPSKPAENLQPTFESYDFSLMDELFSILDSDQNGEDIEPILAGYFNKVVQAFLAKIKTKMLQYILLKREGDVYNRLLAVLQHHSLA